jgi:hypothetical protein
MLSFEHEGGYRFKISSGGDGEIASIPFQVRAVP